MKFLTLLLGIGLFTYSLVALLLFIFQREFLYFPSAKYSHSFPVETFSNDGEQIEIIVLNAGFENAVLYFGGNGESVVHNAPAFSRSFQGQTYYLVNYRGYGGSSGRPAEAANYIDALAIFDTIAKRHKHVAVIGRSLGSGVATFLAAARPIKKLVLITPFDSIQHIAQDQLPIYPMSILLKDKYDSASKIKDITAKTLIILAGQDKTIPFKYSALLIDRFPRQQLTVNTLTNADHNNLSNIDDYYVLIQNFLL